MKIGTARVETFSDGIIAIIITIMVLQLKLPDNIKNPGNKEIINYLLKILPNLTAYLLSFITVGIYWINHHHMFHLVEKADEWLLLQNLFSLFCISLIPTATNILGTNPNLISSSVIYGFVLFMSTISFAIMRVYSNRKKLLHQEEDKKEGNLIYKTTIRAKRKSFIGASFYLIAIPLAFVHVYLSFLCFLIPPILFFIPEGIDDEELVDRISKKNA